MLPWSRRLPSAWIIAPVAAVSLAACTGPSGDAPPGECTCAATTTPPAPSISAEPPSPVKSRRGSESGEGEVLVHKHVPEVWVPDVEVSDLAVHGSSLFWSDTAGIHERPFRGEARDVVPAVQASRLVADEDGVVFATATGKNRFEIRQIAGEERAVRKVAALSCEPHQIALAKSFVVVASTCGILAVPRQGGAPRQLEAEAHDDVSIAANRERTCYVNDHRLTCRSLSDPAEKPVVLDALRPGPLLLNRLALYALEEGPAADVPIDGDYGRLVWWDVTSGARRVLTSRQLETSELQMDDWSLYYGTGGGSIRRVGKNGEQVQTLYKVGRQVTPHLALGTEHIYFFTRDERGIRRFRFPVER